MPKEKDEQDEEELGAKIEIKHIIEPDDIELEEELIAHEKEKLEDEKEPVAKGEHEPKMEIPEPKEEKTCSEETRKNSISDIFGHDENDSFYPKQVRTIGESRIEVQQYDISVEEKKSNEDDDRLTDEDLHIKKPMAPIPMHNSINTSRTLSIATTVSIVVLILGFCGGYVGYKYWPNIVSKIPKSTEKVVPVSSKIITTLSLSPSITQSPEVKTSVSPTPDDPLKNWSNYTNSKFSYSVKYPDNWFSEGTNNNQSAAIQLTSFKPTIGGSEIQAGSKVEIVFQNANGKLLKDWIKDNNIVSGFGTPELTPLKIDGKDAYQQTVVSNGKSTSTYVFQADKVMAINYYAPENTFVAGKTVYNQIINSIKLQ
jgi:hypothetical protein